MSCSTINLTPAQLGAVIAGALGYRAGSAQTTSCAQRCARVYLLAGQSNANNQGGVKPNPIPGQEPAGAELQYIEDFEPVLYSMADYQAATSTLTFERGFGPLRVRRGAAHLPYYAFGPELTLGRELAACHPDPCDTVALIKFASGGTSIESWQPGHSSGVFDAMMANIAQRVAELEQLYDCVTIETMFWVQGEGDSNAPRAELYAERLETFLAGIRTQFAVDFVFSLLKRPSQDADRAMYADAVNQEVIDAGYTTTVDNNDLEFLPQTPIDQHYTATSLFELGRRLAAAK